MGESIAQTHALQEDQAFSGTFIVASIVADDVIKNPYAYGLPEITAARVATGGVVHSVWELETEKGRYYLKIRGNRFAKIPEIVTIPSNIIYEYKALVLLGDLMPDNFPQVSCFKLKEALLIVTDAIPAGESFEALLHARKVTREMLENIGKTLREIHESCKSVPDSIRENKDRDFYLEKLGHKLRYINHPVLNYAIDKISLQPRQIIIGDLSPKNIGVNNDGKRYIFFDLEDVHRGNVVFDIGFLTGHLILHSHYDPLQAIAYVESFLGSYGCKHLGNLLVKIIALGAIMYRLNSIIPYSIDLSFEEKSRMLATIDKTLSTPRLNSISWYELIHRVLRGS